MRSMGGRATCPGPGLPETGAGPPARPRQSAYSRVSRQVLHASPTGLSARTLSLSPRQAAPQFTRFCETKMERRETRKTLTCSCWSNSGKTRGAASSGGVSSETAEGGDCHCPALSPTGAVLQFSPHHSPSLPSLWFPRGCRRQFCSFSIQTEGSRALPARPNFCK